MFAWSPARAQTAVPIKKDRHRRRGDEPERAGSRRLGDRRDPRSADPLRQDGRHRRSGPLCRARSAASEIYRLGARLRPRRFGQGRGRARQAAQSHRRAGAERRGRRAVLSGDLLVFDAENSRRRSVRRQERYSRTRPSQTDWLNTDEEQRLHRLPSARRPRHAHAAEGAWRIQNLRRGLGAPRAVRPGRPADGEHHRRRSRPRRRSNISPTGPTASPRANCPRKPQRPQGIERNVVVTTWDWADEKHYLHDEISTDKRNPTVNGYGPLFGSPEYSTDYHPDPRSGEEQRHQIPRAGARCRHAVLARTGPCRGAQAAGAVALLGQRADLGHPHQQPQFDDGRERPAVAGGRRARRQGSGFLRQGFGPDLGQTVPAASRASARLRCSIRRR